MSSVIFTTHARERLGERQLSENWVEQTILQPSGQRKGKNPGTSEFVKRFGPSQVTAVAHKNQQGDWVVVSAWVDPPVAGTKDWGRKQRYLRYRQAPWWQKILMLVGKQIGVWDF